MVVDLGVVDVTNEDVLVVAGGGIVEDCWVDTTARVDDCTADSLVTRVTFEGIEEGVEAGDVESAGVELIRVVKRGVCEVEGF